MILQSLCGYYARARNSPGADIIEPGYAMQGAAGEIVLDRDGCIVAVNSLADPEDKRRAPRQMIVPLPPKRSGQKPAPAFLYETVAFLFGLYDKPDGAQYRFDASAEIHHDVLDGVDDEAARAVLAFFDRRTLGVTSVPGVDTSLLQDARLFVVFRLRGDAQFVHEREAVRNAWARHNAKQTANAELIQCLITGEQAPLARLHGNVSGFGADKPTLVGFNQDSFCSFGKYGQQGANAPVGERAAFEYVTALNMLLKDRKHHVNLAGDKLLFWAERDAQLEEDTTYSLFNGAQEADGLDPAQRERIKGALEAIKLGGSPGEQNMDKDVRFYLLGLSANKTRLVIRFYYESTFGDMLNNLMNHYKDIDIVGQRYTFPSLYRILTETALDRKADNVPPNLSSALLRSILYALPYPSTLSQGVIRRIRADGEITPLRAGILKGTVNRIEGKEVLKMALDPNERDLPYLLGRLFAMIEKSQRDALGDVNASITDKYLNAALASPQMVFPTLMKLNRAHLSKSEYGYAMRAQISQLFNLIMGLQHDANGAYAFPESLNANGQGKFIVGYYHQMQALYTKKEATTKDEGEAVNGH